MRISAQKGQFGDLKRTFLENILKFLRKKFNLALKLFKKIKLHKSSLEQIKNKTKNFFNKTLQKINKNRESDIMRTKSANQNQEKAPLFLNKSVGNEPTNNPNKSFLMDSLELSENWENVENENKSQEQTKQQIFAYEDNELNQIHRINLKMKDITDLMKSFAENLEQQDEITMQSINFFE